MSRRADCWWRAIANNFVFHSLYDDVSKGKEHVIGEEKREDDRQKFEL